MMPPPRPGELPLTVLLVSVAVAGTDAAADVGGVAADVQLVSVAVPRDAAAVVPGVLPLTVLLVSVAAAAQMPPPLRRRCCAGPCCP